MLGERAELADKRERRAPVCVPEAVDALLDERQVEVVREARVIRDAVVVLCRHAPSQRAGGKKAEDTEGGQTLPVRRPPASAEKTVVPRLYFL